MAKTKISEYSATAASNTDIDSINLSEGVMVPSDLNNAIREQMAHLKDFSDGTSGIDVLNLQDDDGSASIKLQAPAEVTTTTTLTLPDGDGSNNQLIKTDGSGALSWTKIAEANLDISGTGAAGQAVVSDGDGAFEFSAISSYPQVITILTSGTSYDIPASAQAILIKASGGGGGGSVWRFSGNAAANGTAGSDTTVENATLSIDVLAKGGNRGIVATSGLSDFLTGDTGGDILEGGGAAGGSSYKDNFDVDMGDGRPANLVQTYVTGAVGGETLTYSIGAGGAGGSAGGATAADGASGYIELWIW